MGSVKIHKALLPLSWLYGLGVWVRNRLFDHGVLTEHSFQIPVICVGNITVGGTGKTPHTEYLIRLLQDRFQVAVLSRGYKRKSHGFLLAKPETPVEMLGDEPFQMKRKFPRVQVAVDADRVHGIGQLLAPEVSPKSEVVLLDDAFQHRYVRPGKSILLVDYNRLITEDTLLPAGRLREPASGKSRAHLVIVTKCPRTLQAEACRQLEKRLALSPTQQLFFSTLTYGNLIPLDAERSGAEERPLASIGTDERVLLLTGIASPELIRRELEKQTSQVEMLTFPDHHAFTPADIEAVRNRFAAMGKEKKLIVTTEKDATRLLTHPALDEALRKSIYILPVQVEFLQGQQERFNETITDYVKSHSRNSGLHP